MQLNITYLLFAFTLFVFRVNADVEITAPASGATASGSGGSADITLKWDDDADSGDDEFSLKNAKTFTISLCYFTASSFKCFLTPLAKAQTFSSPYSYDASLPASQYNNGNYFFQIYTVFKSGSNTIQYSNAFKVTGMSGSNTVTATATGLVPAAQTSDVNAGTVAVNSASFTVPYTLQTGKTRFAPMQTQPGSTITATTWSMRYPTSAVTYYTSMSGSPVVHSTITPGWNYTAESAVNWATAAPFPTYFYPASSRVSKAQLKTAKKKRWLD